MKSDSSSTVKEQNEEVPAPAGEEQEFPIQELLQEVEKVIDGEADLERIESLTGYSNTTLRFYLSDGRSIMVKQAQYDWGAPRFESSKKASALLLEHTSVVAPRHLSISDRIAHKPVLAYWYLPQMTLEQVWPELSMDQKIEAVQSLGRLLRRVHQIPVSQYGSLSKQGLSYDSMGDYMINDLLERLKPPVWEKWYDAVPVLDRLIMLASELFREGGEAKLVHNDLHMGNILCTIDATVECVGLLDLEAAGGGIWPADIANSSVMYDPLFFENEQEWLLDFDEYLQEGYGKKVDPVWIRFFQIYHLLNMGFFSTLNDDRLHARQTLEKARGLLHEI